MMNIDEEREYRERMGAAAGSLAQRSTEATLSGKQEEAVMLLEAALSAFHIS